MAKMRTSTSAFRDEDVYAVAEQYKRQRPELVRVMEYIAQFQQSKKSDLAARRAIWRTPHTTIVASTTGLLIR